MTLDSVPKPISDLFEAVREIGQTELPKSGLIEDVSEKAIEILPQTGADLAGIFNGILDFFQQADQWLGNLIGVSGSVFLKVLKAIGSLLVWILEGLAYLIKLGISYF